MRNRRSRGFTLVELLVTLAVFAVLALIGYPALLSILEHQKLISAGHEAASTLRLARLTAVKRSIEVKVTASYPDNTLVAYRDLDNDNVFDQADEMIATTALPSEVSFWGPPDAAPGGAKASDFAAATVTFTSQGAATNTGAFRFRGRHPDWFEVRVEPAATGRVAFRKWSGVGDPDDLTTWWRNGEAGRKWTWSG